MLNSVKSKIVTLGIVQDGGYPQPNCKKDCCQNVEKKLITCLGLIQKEKRYIFDCTPDFREQLKLLDKYIDHKGTNSLDGIFLTHAHIGHYTGLIHLGRESMNSKDLPVYCMPKMMEFLTKNAPWSQLVEIGNIKLVDISKGVELDDVKIEPILVPHRSEFTETIGFLIKGKKNSVLFIPDIDKWEKMEKNEIENLIESVNIAYLDGTFYDGNEINRNLSEIPHPFIKSSLERFQDFKDRNKIRFIHLNHTNPCLRSTKELQNVLNQGMNIAKEEEMTFLSE